MAENAARPGRNGYDVEKVKNYWSEIQRVRTQIATIKGEHAKRCQDLNGEIDDIVQSAKDNDGIPKKVLKQLIQERKHQEAADKVRENLPQELVDDYDTIKHALGFLADTPLGEAALEGAPQSNGAGEEASPPA